jgi:hypothetical protein
MKILGMMVVLVGLAANCGSRTGLYVEGAGQVAVVDAGTKTADAEQTDVGDPSWPRCPPAWPPSPPLVYCGVRSGIFCYEIPWHANCRWRDEVVLVPIGDADCEACAAIGVGR